MGKEKIQETHSGNGMIYRNLSKIKKIFVLYQKVSYNKHKMIDKEMTGYYTGAKKLVNTNANERWQTSVPEEDFMMPLSMMSIGATDTIKKITGKDETRRFLGSLGLIEGESVTVVSEIHGNLILGVKDARIALDRSLANRIMV